ncbi:sigma-70 family RNA polymerase sigma factor [Alteribacter populi]|uniref:sigma-70 family RNA polymerase sigma factor n=1 Tax=Alteribacter populi TaxID=2011011 RepID=UPI000BBA826D|nr:sigma-70 family RNA polymerase sigma factor [Alteribacter populi]
MLSTKVKTLLLGAQRGDIEKRNQFIMLHQAFILSTVQHFLKQYVDSSHDLYSEALVAFNETIDKYNPTLGTSFYSFCKTHIRFRLLDYVKRESKHLHSPYEIAGEDGDSFSPADYEKAQQEWFAQKENERIHHAFEVFLEKLNHYKIEPHVLAEKSPQHRDTKEMLAFIIEETIKNQAIVSYKQQRRRLPIHKIAELTNVPRKTIENHRLFIIAYLLILTEKELYPLRHFVKRTYHSESV